MISEPATTLIVFAHGSKVPEANREVARLAEELSRRSGLPAQRAFLDVATPDLAAAVSEAARCGARRVIIVPCFLAMGVHLRQDLPRLVGEQQAAHPGLEILVSKPLEGHPGVAEILAERVRELLAEAPVMTSSNQGT